MLGTYGRRWLRRAGFKHRECQRQGLAAMRAVRAVLSQPGARGGPVTRVLLPPLLAPALDALFPEAGGAPAGTKMFQSVFAAALLYTIKDELAARTRTAIAGPALRAAAAR